MHKDEIEIVEKNDVVCIVRFICNNKNISDLYDFIEGINFSRLNIDVHQYQSLKIQFFKNVGKSRGLKTIYTENKGSMRHFQYNNQQKIFFSQISESEFKETDNLNKIFVFELQYDSTEIRNKSYETMSDPINFQYFSLIMDYLERKNIRYGVFISGKKDVSIYTPLDDKIYYQIRTFLYFCTDYQNEKMRFAKKNDDGSSNWVRLYACEKKDRFLDKNFGRILPLFPIDKIVYEVIQKKHDSLLENYSEDYKKLIECYKRRICNNYQSNIKELATICEHDNYIEELIFLSTLSYILEESKKYELYQIYSLHEICVDYAQGIFQLIENSYFHMIKEGAIGCGNFSIRIRKSSEMQNFLKNSSLKLPSYYMEIYVTDLAFKSEDFCGIVNKLYKNIEIRAAESKDADFRKIYNEMRNTSDSITLPKIFGKNLDQNDLYNRYLNLSVSVAHHYGLQILNNAISVGDGYLCVRSGRGENDYYSENNNKYCDQKIGWKNGTAYIIYLPLNLTKRIDYRDSIAIPGDLEEKTDGVEFDFQILPGDIISKISKVEVFNSSEEKEKCISDLIEKVDCKNTSEKSMYYLDCERIGSDYSYEILAKTVFLCLTQKNINHIAIINVKDKQEVVKLFRQFALFYDRRGKNHFMDKKSVFIVDKQAQMDLLLRGTISDIKKDMYIGQIYGGIDEITMKIIEHLGRKEE